MSVPDNVMQRMMAGAGGGAPNAGPPLGAQPGMPQAGAQPGATPPPQSPSAAPMSKPQDKRGLKAAAQTNVHIAVNMLEEALPAFGSESPEGGKILAALKTLSSMVAKRDSSDLVPAELLQLIQRSTQMGGGTAIQQQLRKQMAAAKPQPAQAA